MNRRRFLRASGATVTGGLAVAGCLERLGFEEESAWRDPPLVDDRPDAVYVPASMETMGVYGSGTTSDGEYAVALSYTVPHRFWTVVGNETNRVTVGTDDTMHLMCTVWDPETDTVLPVELAGEIRRDGDRVGEFSPWPMLSQRMGFHYGDNVELPGEGTYTVSLSVGPITATPTGDFAGRFDAAGVLDLEFEYERSDIHDLEFEPVDHDERGSRGALPLMDHGAMEHDHVDGDGGAEHEDAENHTHDEDGDGDPDRHEHDGDEDEDENGENGHGGSHGGESDLGHPPTARGPSIESLEGRHVGTESSADARISVLESGADRFRDASDSGSSPSSSSNEASYLAVFTRTPHNDVILPLMSLSGSLERDGDAVVEEPLRETLDHEFGHHYGLEIGELEPGDLLRITVDSHPQIARHDGYETAFFEFDDVTFTV